MERTALRTKSFALRELLAHLASRGELTYDEIITGAECDWDLKWLAALGRVVALQRLRDDDLRASVPLLRRGIEGLKPRRSEPYRRLLAEVLYTLGDFRAVKDLVDRDEFLREVDYGFLVTDLLNPFVGSPFSDEAAWQERFSRFFTDHDIPAPTLKGPGAVPFDRLTCESGPAITEGPLVSVIMTTYQPEREALLTSVRSILEQTWRNLELIVVDDASPFEFSETLDEVAAIDPRVTVVRLPVNRGTYVARNVGFDHARGAYITGQDSDDWSHPERIARQVAVLEADSTIPGSHCKSITVSDRFVMLRPGIPVTRRNVSSLMISREVLETVGGFLPARKGADSEFCSRIERVFGTALYILPDPPLTIVRVRTDSLSRSDFSAAWRHELRTALIDAYRHWHSTRRTKEITSYRPSLESPIPIPGQYAPDRGEPETFDVVFAGDWREYGGPQRSMIEEIKALSGHGLRIGILHLEAARFMTKRNVRLCDPIMELLHQRHVTRVTTTDINRVRLLILQYPPILQFPPADPVSLKVERLIIVANQAPSERDGSDVRYEPNECSDNAERLFGVRALWVPQGPIVRRAIEPLLPPSELAEFDMPGIIDIDAWVTDRRRFRSNIPVVGRHSRDTAMKWPKDAKTLRLVYPTDGSVDVRVMGGGLTVSEILGGSTPESWVVFGKDELDVRTFLNSIDFFVYFQHPDAFEAFGRAVLEAIATGCVAILPPHFEATFGSAAVYAEESEAIKRVHELYSSPSKYLAQSRAAVAFARDHFSYESYARRVLSLLERRSLLDTGVGV